MIITRGFAGACVAFALVSGSAMASPWRPPAAMWNQCATGFTASHAIDRNIKYDQSYTCTGPAVQCTFGFSLNSPIVGTNPGPAGGQLSNSTPIYGSPVVLNGGVMVYTCAEPSKPPG